MPALTDSELGLDLAKHALERDFVPGKEADLEKFFAPVPNYNPFLDLHNYAQRILKAKLGNFYHRRGRSQELGPASGAVCRDHKHAYGSQTFCAAVQLCGADLPGTGALGRIERLYLQRRRFLGQIREPRRRRAVCRGALRRHNRLAAADTCSSRIAIFQRIIPGNIKSLSQESS